jgi:hypothetical protein
VAILKRALNPQDCMSYPQVLPLLWPLQVSQEQFDKILGLINKGVQEGAKVEVGGKRYGVLQLKLLLPDVASSQDATSHRMIQPAVLALNVEMGCGQGRRATLCSQQSSAMSRMT